MLDDFFVRAVLAGIGIALVAGPLGCFVVWRRMAYFGDTMAHSALLGVALSTAFEIDLMLGVFGVAAIVARMGAGDESLAAVDPVDQAAIDQLVEGAIDLQRRAKAFVAQAIEDGVGA